MELGGGLGRNLMLLYAPSIDTPGRRGVSGRPSPTSGAPLRHPARCDVLSPEKVSPRAFR